MRFWKKKPEVTGDRVKSIAARGLATGKLTPEEIRIVCGSCLTQAPDREEEHTQ